MFETDLSFSSTLLHNSEQNDRYASQHFGIGLSLKMINDISINQIGALISNVGKMCCLPFSSEVEIYILIC